MKKLILAAVAATVATAGFAGSYATPAASQPATTQNAYVELAGGYALTNYVKFHNKTAANYKNDNGGFAFGVDAGYVFMPHFGAEVGFMMPFTKTEFAANTKNKVSQYSFYGAGRLETSLGQPNFNLFALAGLGYTSQKDKASAAGTEVKSSGFGFVGGFGADYEVAQNVTVGAKYLRLAGKNDNSKSTAPSFAAPQYFLVTLGYKINM
jgi:opacity protein-like surface antigen